MFILSARLVSSALTTTITVSIIPTDAHHLSGRRWWRRCVLCEVRWWRQYWPHSGWRYRRFLRYLERLNLQIPIILVVKIADHGLLHLCVHRVPGWCRLRRQPHQCLVFLRARIISPYMDWNNGAFYVHLSGSVGFETSTMSTVPTAIFLSIQGYIFV